MAFAALRASKHAVGLRVYIIQCCGQLCDADCNHQGAQGTITAHEVTAGHEIPVITLDDSKGTLRGWECWWCPLDEAQPKGGDDAISTDH